MEAGRVEEGRRVLARLHGQAFADAATLEIQDAIAVEHAAQRGKGYAECFAKCVRPRERVLPFVVAQRRLRQALADRRLPAATTNVSATAPSSQSASTQLNS